MRRCLHIMVAALAALWLSPAALAAAEEAEHHGPLRASEVFASPQFWAAALNFVLLLYVLRRLGARPLAAFLQNRRSEMERSMNEAAEMKQKAEAKYNEYKDRLAQLDQELSKLRSDIARSAEEDKQRIVAEAEENAQRLKRETESLIEQYAKALGKDVRSEVVEAAVAAAEKLLREALTAADQQRLADGFKQGLGGAAAGGNAARPASRGTRAQETP